MQIRREFISGRMFGVKEFAEGEGLVKTYWVDLTTLTKHLKKQGSFMEAIANAILLADSYNRNKLVNAFDTQINYVLERDIGESDKHPIKDLGDF